VFDLRLALYDKLSRLPLAYFSEARTGDLMSRLGSDVDAVQDVVIRGTDSVIANFLRLVGVAIIFCSLNLQLGLATLAPDLVVGLFPETLSTSASEASTRRPASAGRGERQTSGQSGRYPGHQGLRARGRGAGRVPAGRRADT
jgi:ABC-type multidrug transport system fused ATPase/permease subunit